MASSPPLLSLLEPAHLSVSISSASVRSFKTDLSLKEMN